MQPDKSGIYDGHIGRIRSQLYNHVKFEPQLDNQTGGFLCRKSYYLTGFYHLVLKIYQGGKYCTFPHAIEFLNKKYADTFTILTSYPELENYLSPFMDAWESNAQDQLQGQLASAKFRFHA